MGRKKQLLAWLICGLLCLAASFPAWASIGSSGNGAVPTQNGTEVQAGVVVDYMGKLRFVVLNKKTLAPIPEASVEIYIKSLKRYVLVGLTDNNGVFELDVAYNSRVSDTEGNEVYKEDGKYYLNKNMIYLNDNNIYYRVYHSEWTPYPSDGSKVLDDKVIPETITVYLSRRERPSEPDPPKPDPTPGPGTNDNHFNEGGTTFVDKLLSILEEALPLGGLDLGGTGTSGIPKTGVEGAIHYWAFGLVFFLLAAVAMWRLLKSEKEGKDKKRESVA